MSVRSGQWTAEVEVERSSEQNRTEQDREDKEKRGIERSSH